MYEEKPFTGSDLPSKTLCLTYDDGPGKDTLAIAEFLYEQNIRATFFVVGKYAIHSHHILERVSSLGHLIGNHTYEHPDMPYYLSENGDVINQVLRTDSIIKKYVDGKTVFFRSPYGKWSKEVANELNLHLLSTFNHVGPINWDVGGIDCWYWKNGKSVEEAVTRYLEEIGKVNKGIVVMHDEIADMEYLKKENNTLNLTKQLIPILRQQGYRFVRLDEITSIKKSADEPFRFTLQCSDRKFLYLSRENSNEIHVGKAPNNSLREWRLLSLENGKIALQASNGLYLSVKEDDISVTATSEKVGDEEAFDLIPVSLNRLMLRAFNGNYLCKKNKSCKILAAAQFMRGGEVFTFTPTNVHTKQSQSLNQRWGSMIRKLAYIKSKVREKFF